MTALVASEAPAPPLPPSGISPNSIAFPVVENVISSIVLTPGFPPQIYKPLILFEVASPILELELVGSPKSTAFPVDAVVKKSNTA